MQMGNFLEDEGGSMINQICDGFDLYSIAERVRHGLGRVPEAQILNDVYSLMEQCVLVTRTRGPECAAARAEMNTMMASGWFERWDGAATGTSTAMHGHAGPRFERIREMIGSGRITEAHAELAEMANDLPSSRTV